MDANNLEKWYQCQSDSDCIVVDGICGNPVAINKKYQEDFIKYVRVKSVGTACSPPTSAWVAFKARVKAECVLGKCTLIDPLDKPHEAPPAKLE